VTCSARAEEGPRGDDIIYYIIHFISRRPLIGANTHSETAVNRPHNLTILSRRRCRRPIYSLFLFCSGYKYIMLYVGTEPTVHAAAPKLDARRVSLLQHRFRLYYGVFSVDICVCYAVD